MLSPCGPKYIVRDCSLSSDIDSTLRSTLQDCTRSAVLACSGVLGPPRRTCLSAVISAATL